MMPFSTMVERANGNNSHSEKKVGRMWTVGTPDQFEKGVRRSSGRARRGFSESSRARKFATCLQRLLERRARLAACAKYAVA